MMVLSTTEVLAQKTDDSIQEIAESVCGVRMADIHLEFINHFIPGADMHACEPKLQNMMEPVSCSYVEIYRHGGDEVL